MRGPLAGCRGEVGRLDECRGGAGEHRGRVARAEVAGEAVGGVGHARLHRAVGVPRTDRRTLGGVAGEQRLAGTVGSGPRQLPAQVVPVVDRGVEPDRADRCHAVRGVADEERRPRPRGRGELGDEVEDGRAEQLGAQVRDARGRAQQRRPVRVVDGDVGVGGARTGVAPPVVAEGDDQAVLQGVQPVGPVADHGSEVGPEQHLDVATDPAEVLDVDAESRPHAAARAVGTHDEPGAHRRRRAGVPVADMRPGALVVDGEVDELRGEPDLGPGTTGRVEQDRFEEILRAAGREGRADGEGLAGEGEADRVLGEVGVDEGPAERRPGEDVRARRAHVVGHAPGPEDLHGARTQPGGPGVDRGAVVALDDEHPRPVTGGGDGGGEARGAGADDEEVVAHGVERRRADAAPDPC